MSACAITDFVYHCRCGKHGAGGERGVVWWPQSPDRNTVGSCNPTRTSRARQDAPGYGPASAVICRALRLVRPATLTPRGTSAAIVGAMRRRRRASCAIALPAWPLLAVEFRLVQILECCSRSAAGPVVGAAWKVAGDAEATVAEQGREGAVGS